MGKPLQFERELKESSQLAKNQAGSNWNGSAILYLAAVSKPRPLCDVIGYTGTPQKDWKKTNKTKWKNHALEISMLFSESAANFT